MSNHRKTWKVKEKLEILHHVSQYGPSKTSREYGVSQATIYRWRQQYELDGEPGLSGVSRQTSESEELRRLKRENAQLKHIVAEKELQLRIQSEMLKKSL